VAAAELVRLRSPEGRAAVRRRPANELNSDTEESTGSIRFRRASCGRRLRLAFRVSARVGSELSDLEPLHVRGSFSASS